METENLIDELSNDITAVKPIKVKQVFTKWCFAVTFYLATVVALRGIADSQNKLADNIFILEMVLSLITCFISGFLAIKLAFPNSERKKIWNFAPIIPLISMGYLIFISSELGTELISLKQSIQNDHFLITLTIILYSLPIAIYSFIKVGSLSPTQLSWNGFMIIMAASSGAHFLVRVTEQADNLVAILVWCYFPIIILSLTGIAIGNKLLKW